MRHPLDGITVVALEQAMAAPFFGIQNERGWPVLCRDMLGDAVNAKKPPARPSRPSK